MSGLKSLLYFYVLAGQKIRHRRIDLLIRTSDFVAALFQHTGQGGHGRAADANQMDMGRRRRSPVQGQV